MSAAAASRPGDRVPDGLPDRTQGSAPVRTILAALALHEGEEWLAVRAGMLALRHRARLVLLHAIEGADSLPAAHRVPAMAALRAAALAGLGRAAESAAESAPESAAESAFAGGPLVQQLLVEEGRAHACILAAARRLAADVLVIGPGKGATRRDRLFGSTADRLLREAEAPVLVVKRAADGPYRRVIAGVGAGANPEGAAAAAARLAPDALLTLLHVVERPPAFQQALLESGVSGAAIEAHYRQQRRQRRRELHQLAARLAARSGAPQAAPARVRVTEGVAADVLVRAARLPGVGLIAVDRCERSAVAKLLLGSVARTVLQRAPADVLVVAAPR